MRKFALAMVLAAGSVQAAEQLKFGDVNYFLKQGEFNILADVSSTYDKFSQDGGDTLETRGTLIETRYAYGFNDQLNFFLGLDYAYDREVENKTNSNSNYDQAGLANPMLGANYRWMKQSADSYNIDFGAVARFNVMDAETGSASGGSVEDGNFAQPRGSLELNARMGRKWDEANEWQLVGGLVYNNSGEYKVLGTGGASDTDVDLDSSFDVFVRATYQYRPVNEFMLLVSLQGTRIGEVEGDADGTDVSDSAHIDVNFRFAAKYLITDNFILKFNYGQNIVSQEFERDTGAGSFDVDRRRSHFFGLGAEFLF